MDHAGNQRRHVRNEEEGSGSYPSQIPRPFNGSSARNPVQLSSPPRAHQYRRQGPGNPYRQHTARHHNGSTNGIDATFESPHKPQYPHRQHAEHNPPPVSYHPTARHYSHISALSSSQAGLDSRPISEIGSPTTTAPFASRAVSEIGEEEEPDTAPVFHNRDESRGRRGKSVTTPQRSRKNSVPLRDSETLPSTDQAATMEALTAAIRQGLSPTTATLRSATPKPFGEVAGVRMPFQGEPSSPSSVYTDATNKRFSVPLSSYQGYDPRDSKPSTIAEQETSEHEPSPYAHDLPTPMSTHPIMSADNKNTRRPPKLDIAAVREAEARGSMTSLSDLIKRATRLASNLDRGRTASRLGHLDMFGGSSDKLGGNARASTYSDVLNSFPPPADGANAPGDRPTTMWPNGEKQFMASKSSLGRFVDINEAPVKAKRKCCGLSPPIFVTVLVIVFLLVAAAVLVPIFLIYLPKQRQNSVDLTTCPSSHPCKNGGVSVSTGSACSCICVDGFTGNDCTTQRDPACMTSSMADGSTTYDNATIGSSVLAFLSGENPSFSIPLNITTILAQFAYNNLSCASENSLVDFGVDQSSAQVKRFVILPGMMSTEPHVPALNLPHSEVKFEHAPRFVIVEGLTDAAEELQLLPDPTLLPRQDATQSANGIVFATSDSAPSATSAPAATTSTSDATGSASPTSTSTSSSTTNNNRITADISSQQLDFAAVVVLYVLQTSSEINVAVAANQAILSYLHGGSGNGTVQVVSGEGGMKADLKNYHITLANGTMIGKEG